MLEAIPQCHHPLELAVVVLRIPDRSVQVRDGEGVIFQLIGWKPIIVQGCCVDEWLEGGSRLTLRLGGAVEAAVGLAVPRSRPPIIARMRPLEGFMAMKAACTSAESGNLSEGPGQPGTC